MQLYIPSFEIKFPFQFTARPDSFFIRLDDLSLPDNNLFSIIGQEQKVILVDEAGTMVISGPYHLIRIITTLPTPQSPTGLQSVTAQPLFQWQNYSALFTFQFEVKVFVVNAGVPVLIHHKKNLSSNLQQYQYPDSLPTGTYFWAVGVRDNLGNFSRSKEASFIVP